MSKSFVTVAFSKKNNWKRNTLYVMKKDLKYEINFSFFKSFFHYIIFAKELKCEWNKKRTLWASYVTKNIFEVWYEFRWLDHYWFFNFPKSNQKCVPAIAKNMFNLGTLYRSKSSIPLYRVCKFILSFCKCIFVEKSFYFITVLIIFYSPHCRYIWFYFLFSIFLKRND